MRENAVGYVLLRFLAIFAEKNTMERLRKTNIHLNLSKYGINEKFDVYELGSYDFSTELDFGGIAAVYIFTKLSSPQSLNPSNKGQKYKHTIIYCGMTGDTDQRFAGHFKKEGLSKHEANRICIHECKNESEAKTLESKILKTFNFPLNDKENGNPEYPSVKKV